MVTQYRSKATITSRAVGVEGQNYIILKLSVVSFGLDSALQTEYSIMSRCYEIWELLR
jgi:hypothetical protein